MDEDVDACGPPNTGTLFVDSAGLLNELNKPELLALAAGGFVLLELVKPNLNRPPFDAGLLDDDVAGLLIVLVLFDAPN